MSQKSVSLVLFRDIPAPRRGPWKVSQLVEFSILFLLLLILKVLVRSSRSIKTSVMTEVTLIKSDTHTESGVGRKASGN